MLSPTLRSAVKRYTATSESRPDAQAACWYEELFLSGYSICRGRYLKLIPRAAALLRISLHLRDGQLMFSQRAGKNMCSVPACNKIEVRGVGRIESRLYRVQARIGNRSRRQVGDGVSVES